MASLALSPERREVMPMTNFDSISMDSPVESNNSSWNCEAIRIGAFKSVHTVVLKSKINLLLPFGPSAILLHYTTGKNVRIK